MNNCWRKLKKQNGGEALQIKHAWGNVTFTVQEDKNNYKFNKTLLSVER
jgi:hypothetical protein